MLPSPSAGWATPSPQQYCLLAGPFDLPAQSEQVLQFSPGSQMPLPHTGPPPLQSTAQLPLLSGGWQIESPQQVLPGGTGVVVQLRPPEVQRASLHVTGFCPSPSPQQ